MRKELQDKITMYHAINDITMRGEIVVFGSTFMANFPFYEFSKKYLMNNAIYNRSIEDLTLTEAEEILNECILEIKPDKIFLSLGEKDLENSAAICTYGRIIRKIKTKLPDSKIYVLSIKNEEKDGTVYAFNENLQALCAQLNVTFLPLPDASDYGDLYRQVFKKLNFFFHGRKISFSEAFAYAD